MEVPQRDQRDRRDQYERSPIAGIGAHAIWPAPDQETGIGGRSRINRGVWILFVGWTEVFPGNRGMDRRGRYDLYDAPAGIRLAVQEGQTSHSLLIAETPCRSRPFAGRSVLTSSPEALVERGRVRV